MGIGLPAAVFEPLVMSSGNVTLHPADSGEAAITDSLP
jgi:hypothetical protein